MRWSRVHIVVWDAIRLGDRLRPGSNAELELVDYRIASLKPKKLAFDDAAALPLCAITAWEGIVEKMGIPVNVNGPVNPKSLLIVNGAGGVGSIAIQIARRVLNLQHVVATASRPESVAWCEKMGATAVINHKEPLGPQLEKLGIKSIDYAFLCFDPDLFMDELAGLISPMGHINCILPVMKLSPAASGGLFWKAAVSCLMDVIAEHFSNCDPAMRLMFLSFFLMPPSLRLNSPSATR